MTSLNRRRGLAAFAAAAVVAALVPLTAAPASALGEPVLSGPTSTTSDTPVDYTFTGGGVLLENAQYCLASSSASKPLDGVYPDNPSGNELFFGDVAFPTPGNYTIGVIEVGFGATCTGYGSASNFVSGVSLSVTVTSPVVVGDIAVTPTFATTPAGGSTVFTGSVTGAGGTAIPGQTVNVGVSGRNYRAATVTTNQAGSFTYTLADTSTSTTAYSDFLTFTTTLSSSGGASSTYTAYATVTYQPSGSITVTPATATTVIGQATSFTVAVAGANNIALPGVPVYVMSTGRNTYLSRFAGYTNPAGQLSYTQYDTAPASSSATTDSVVFTANNRTATATITYIAVGKLTVAPATANTNVGGSTLLTATLSNAAGQPLAGVPVSVAIAGRNALSTTVIGPTNGAGQVTYTLKDTNNLLGAPMTDTVTFSAAGLTAQSVVTYVVPTPVTATISSPTTGQSISSGGYFNVFFSTTGPVPSGTVAYLTLNGLAKAKVVLGGPGNASISKIPAQAGQYAMRIGGGGTGPVLAESSPFSLNIIPFQIVGQPDPGAGQLNFTVATGNWSPGTPISLTRNGLACNVGRVVTQFERIVIACPNVPGTYQVRVNSNQGYVYGNLAGVVTIDG